jgi:hypothetical protein
VTHEQAHALLLDLAYGELEPEELSEVSRHAAECAACAAELEGISALRALAADLGDGPAPARGRDELVEAARRAVAKRPTRRWFTRPAALSFGAAAAVVAIVTGVTLQLTREGGQRAGEELAVTAPEPPSSAPQGFSAAPPAPEPPPEAARREAPAPEAAPPAGPSAPSRSKAAAAGVAAAPPASARVERDREPSTAVGAAPLPASPSRTMAGPPAAARAVAPEGAAAPARKRAERRATQDADALATAEGDGTSQQVMEDVERRLAAGELTEERRQLRCGDAPVERVALVASGGHVVKVSERRGGAPVLEGWYDGTGRLRATRTVGGEAGAERAAASLPRVAPSLEALATACSW